MVFNDIIIDNRLYSIVISGNVLNKMSNYIQWRRNDPESGGILTGEVHEKKIVIFDCSEPNNYDAQSRYNFLRSKKGAQLFLNDKFLKSGGREVYLGEWHTHPENLPTPSNIDIVNFQESIKVSFINSKNLLMIIMGLKGVYLRVYKKGQFKNKYLFHYDSLLKNNLISNKK